LQERRYEIGVKRALGAGKMHIVRQFLYESLCVLLFDTLLSATLVIDLMVGYKSYQAFVLEKEWIIFISPYSVIMFLVCSLSLSVVFSLIFAFQSMQVEIISNLREE
jgi:ABC-type antimicrobial peptide transport system permease subunit